MFDEQNEIPIENNEYAFIEEGVFLDYDEMETILMILDMYLDACEAAEMKDEYEHVDIIAQKILNILAMSKPRLVN